MVHFTLPRNSKVQRGKTWNEPENKETWKEFRVYRWNPDDDENPHLDSYWVDTDALRADGSRRASSRSRTRSTPR